MMRMQNSVITIKRMLLILMIVMLVAACFAGCGASTTDTIDRTEGSAERSFRNQMANAGVTEITLDKDLVLETPLEVNGTKVLCGEGSIIATGTAWAGDEYMIVVPSGAQLTIKGSVSVDANGITGGVRAAQGATWGIEESAVVKNASAKAANTLVEGKFQMNGGTMADALGHNIHNKGEVTVSEGEIIGSGTEYAGIYSEGTLIQNGGTIRGAYNNVVMMAGEFTFNGGNNQASIRDGIYAAEGTKLSVTAKAATITDSGVRGIYLCGEATIDGITMGTSGDTLVKVSKTGTLHFNGGTLAEAGYHAVENAGTMVVTGGTIRNSYNCGIVNTGTLEVTGGSFLDNVNNKAILNKHDGKATISGQAVMFTGNRFAVANEDTAVLDLSKAELLLTTITNVYAYDGTVNIHDIALGASGSNNVRIYKAEVTMSNVQILGNSATGSSTTHGILLEGGELTAKDIEIRNVTGYGIRNKGGHITAENMLINKSLKAGGINNTVQDHTGFPGVVDIKNLTIEQIRYNNIVVDGGTLTVTDAKLDASGTNNVKITDGTLNLKNVEILGNVPDISGTNHTFYSTGGTVEAENVQIKNAKITGLRMNGETAVFNGKNVTIADNTQYGIDLTVGNINIDGLTMSGNHYNITNNGGNIKLRNSTLGATVSNNTRIHKGSIDLRNVVVNGHTPDHTKNVHALFVSGGTLTGNNITVRNVANVGLRVAKGTTDIKGLTVESAGTDAVWASAGKTTIHDLVVKKAGGAGVSATTTAEVMVTGGSISNTASHGVKSENEAKLTLKDMSVGIATTKGRHAVLAQGGDIQLENIKVVGVKENTEGSGIRINRETSHISGSNIDISGVNHGLSASTGYVELKSVTMSGNNYNVDNNGATIKLSDSTLDATISNNTRTNNGALELNNVAINGHVENHVENVHALFVTGGTFAGKDITVRDVSNVGLRMSGGEAMVENLTVESAGTDAVWADDGKTTISNLVVKQAGGAGISATATAEVTVTGGSISNTASHGVKSENEAKLTIKDMSVGIATIDGRHAVLAQGGDIHLENIKIAGFEGNISGSGIRINKDTSHVSGKGVVISDVNTGISASAGTADIFGVTTQNNTAYSAHATTTAKLVITDADFGITGTHNVKAESEGTITLNNAVIRGTKTNNGLMAENNGNLYGKDITVLSAANGALRLKSGVVDIQNLTVEDANADGVWVSEGKATLENLVIKKAGGAGIAATETAEVTVTGGSIINTASHSVKSENEAKLTLKDMSVGIATIDGRHAVLAQGGDIQLENIKIAGFEGNISGSGIRINKDTSHVSGKGVVISDVNTGISATAGTADVFGVTTQNNTAYSAYATATAKLVITDADFGITGTHNVKAESEGTITLNNAVIRGTTTNNGLMAEDNGNLYGKDITVLSAANGALRLKSGVVDIQNLTVEDANADGVWVSEGKATLENLVIKKAGGAGIAATETAEVIVTGGSISNTANHGVKGENEAKLTLKDMSVGIATTDGRHAILAQGGDIDLENIKIVAAEHNKNGSGIRVNRAESSVVAKNVEIDGTNIGLSVSLGKVQAENIEIRNTTGIGVNVTPQGQDEAIVTLNNLVADNCGTHAIYTSGAKAMLTVNGATLGNDGSDHVINLNGGPLVLNDVAINGANLAADKHELYSGAGWLTIGGAMDADIYIATDRVIKVNKELTGDALTVEWKTAPTGNALEFAGEDIMNASKDNIRLGATQTAVNGQLHFAVATDKYYAKLISSVVTSETQLKDYITYVAAQNIAEVDILIGGDFEIKNQITVPASITKLTVRDDGNTATGNTVTYSGSTDGLFATNGSLQLSGISLNATKAALLKHTGGALAVENCVLSSAKSGIVMTGGTAELNNATVSGSTSINVSGGEMTINGSTIGTSTGDNIVAGTNGIIRLNNTQVLSAGANNIVATKGRIYLTDSTVTGGNYSVLVQDAGYAELNNVTINNSAKDGIRVNRADGQVVVNGNVDITNPIRYGISAQKGSVTVNGDLTISSNAGKSHAIYVYDSGSVVTGNGATIAIDGTEYGVSVGLDRAASVELSNVTISNCVKNSVKLELGTATLNDITANDILVSGGELTIGGAMDADVYVDTDPGSTIKVNKTLTGNALVVDWKVAPAGNAITFANAEMMNASKGSIQLGEVQSANYVLEYAGAAATLKAINVQLSNVVTSTDELNAYLAYAVEKGMTDVTVKIGGNFTIAKQVSIPASITNLTIQEDGNSATGNTVTYSGSTDGLFATNGNLQLSDISLNATKAVLLKHTGGALAVENCALRSAKSGVVMTGGTAVLNNATVSGSTSINVSGGEMTINGSTIGTSTGDNIVAGTNGVIRLNNTQVLSAGANNIVATKGRIYLTDSTVTGGNYSVLVQDAGYAEVNNVTINNSAKDGIRVNRADGQVVVNGTVVITNPIRYGISAQKGSVTVNGDLTISSNAGKSHAIYVYDSGSVATGNGATIAIDGTEYGVSVGLDRAASVELSNVTISNCVKNSVKLALGTAVLNDITANDILVSGGELTIGGAMDADVYVDTDPGSAIKVNKELTGNALVVDWRVAPTGNVMTFASEAVMNASMDNITLGSTQGATKVLAFANKAATLVTYTAATSWADLNTKVSALSSGSKTTYRITGEASNWMVSAPLTIPAGAEVTLYGGEGAPAITVASGVSPFAFNANTALTLERLTVGGTAEAKAKHIIIPVNATLTLKNATLQYFDSARGGAVHVNKGTLIAIGSTFANNSNTTNWGGAIGIWGGTVKACYTTFTGNTAKLSGGAIINYKADGSSEGGSKDGTVGTLELTNCYFTNNRSTNEHGGAVVSWSNGTTTITGCVFGVDGDKAKGNTANNNGGAIHVDNAHTLRITNCEFFSNSAVEGGAIYIKNSVKVDVTGCAFSDNAATGNGGAILLNGTAEIRDTTFTGNSGKEGGAISVVTGKTLTLHNVECADNTTTRATDLSTYGYGDIRVADNQSAGEIKISGKIVATIWNNQAHAVKIVGALTEGSRAVIDWRLAKLSANKVGLVFSSKEIMEASKSFIILGKDASETENWKLQYSDAEPWQAIVVKAQ